METTGLCHNSCEIIQIAATRFKGNGVIAGDMFFSYCKPSERISSFITQYTGISNADVANAPLPIEVLHKFSKFVGESVIMAHNGNRFDTKFLEATCGRHGVKQRPVQAIDTMAFSRKLFGTTRGTGHSLDRVMQRLGLSVSDYRRHDARGDVLVLADAVKLMWEKLELDLHCSGIPRKETILPHV